MKRQLTAVVYRVLLPSNYPSVQSPFELFTQYISLHAKKKNPTFILFKDHLQYEVKGKSDSNCTIAGEKMN